VVKPPSIILLSQSTCSIANGSPQPPAGAEPISAQKKAGWEFLPARRVWYAWQGSNLRPTAPEAVALIQLSYRRMFYSLNELPNNS
jgi:carbonic anhydrase